MKLLFDENLSHRLVSRLADVYPDSQHARDLGLKSAADRLVLQFAGLMDAVLVTRDHDLDDLVVLDAYAGKVLRLDLGNASTEEIESALRGVAEDLPALFEGSRLVAVVRP